MSALKRLVAALRPRPRIPEEQLALYGESVSPVIRQLGALYQAWRRDLELNAGEDELANSTSIHRWEAAGLIERLAAIEPPAPLGRAHALLASVTEDTARASRLLSSGYRFHSSRARCDGHALMLSAEERYGELCRELTRLGVNVPPAGAAGEQPAP